MGSHEGVEKSSNGLLNSKEGYAVRDKNWWSKSTESVSRKWWCLESKKLCEEARQRTGLADFGDTEVEARLSVLTRSIEGEANLHSLGRFLARMHLRDLLEKRLQLVDIWKKSEAIGAEIIQRPIFITGMPRSGSTFLHELLAQDDCRAPLVWEVMYPPTLPGEMTRESERLIKKADACLWWFRRIAPGADKVHPMRATSPHECVAIHSYTLLSQEFPTIFRLPSYKEFLNNADFRPAYFWQKRFLQFLQIGRSSRRWVLKAPDHIFNMESLFHIFPDAMIIQTHRDPIEVLKSCTQLVQVLRAAFAYPEPKVQVGEQEARGLADGVERITQFRDAHPELADRFIDVNYQQIVADPVGTVRWCRLQLDLPSSDAALDRVRGLAAQRSRYPHRRDGSTLADFGIDVLAEARRFENYCARFGIC